MLVLDPPKLEKCRDCDYRGLGCFCNLSDDARCRFDEVGVHLSFPKRTILFEEKQAVSNIFIVCSGRLKLSATSPEGRTMILRLAGPGDVLGLSAALVEQPHEVTAETVEPSQLKSIRVSDFLPIFENYGMVSKNSARTLAREYHSAYLDARRLAISHSASGRLAQLLIEWAGPLPAGGAEQPFAMSLTHRELANMSGISRETVTRLLNQFERNHLIHRHGACVTILDRSGLARADS
jgi:CRP/FNR family transcriptional regulator